MSQENDKTKSKINTAMNNSDDSDNNVKSDDDDEEDDKQMIGGCCVCGDDSGCSDNLLVYCDGIDCQVAVHQCCYGILNVPEDSWYCGSCKHKIELATNALKTKSTSNTAAETLNQEFKKIKCELCPCRDGALKRTHNGKWAHVVCALYIPEICFGNVKTMEPIILKDIKQDRFNKKCSICESDSDGTTSTGTGVYVNCNKQGCKHWFHVTCAQSKGLLTEESSNKNNLNYSIYCKLHSSKLGTEGVKKLPAFSLSHCTQQNDNSNNTPINVNNLISCINKSLKEGGEIPRDLTYFYKSEKLKLKSEKRESGEKTGRKSLPRIGKESIVEFSEKKKKRFSFNAAQVLQNTNHNTNHHHHQHNNKPKQIKQEPKIKSTLNETNHNIQNNKITNDDLLNDSKLNVLNTSLAIITNQDKNNKIVRKSSICQEPTKSSECSDAKKIDTKSTEQKLLNEIKITEIKVIDDTKNDDSTSVKSFCSTSTTSTSKRKNENNKIIKESKKLKVDAEKNEDSIDQQINPISNTTDTPTTTTTTTTNNNNNNLAVNIDENKLGIVTPSTSSCASSITSNCAESEKKIPKAKIRNLIQKPSLETNIDNECIDVFGNFINRKCEQDKIEKENNLPPDSLEELLTKQWDLGESLIKESTNNFDCMDLLNLIYKCKQENAQMEIKIKTLEKTNIQHSQMNKKLCKPFPTSELFNFDSKSDFVKKSNSCQPSTFNTTTTPTTTTTSLNNSFNKVINDQVQTHITSSSSSFTPTNQANQVNSSLSSSSSSPSFSYNNLIHNLNFMQKTPVSPSSQQQTSNNNHNSLLNLYSKAMHGQSPSTNQCYTSSSTAQFQSPSKSQQNQNIPSILGQNQLLQSFQQLNPIQQQQITNFYYMAAAGAQANHTTPGTSTSFNH